MVYLPVPFPGGWPVFQQLNGNLVPAALRGPALVSKTGVPRYWSAIWCAMSASDLADSTLTQRLRYVEDLYVHADELLGTGALDDALGTAPDQAVATILESRFISIRIPP